MNGGYFSTRMLMSTVRCRLFHSTDVGRWGNLNNHDSSWSGRTQLIAGLVPRGSRVVEFGAGRRQLEGLLDASCSYVPSDIVDRGPGTIVFDLNRRPLPDISTVGADVAVFAGVFEYLADLESIPVWLAQSVSTCIASYECARTRPRSLARAREVWTRARVGWANTFDEDQLRSMFANAGMPCTHRTVWEIPGGDEEVFVFSKPGSLSTDFTNSTACGTSSSTPPTGG